MSDDHGKEPAQVSCPTCGQDYPAASVHRCLYERTTEQPSKGQSPGEERSEPALRSMSIEVGQILGGKYQIVKRLSEGGMGTVYVARHTGLGALVALKLLKGDGNPLFEQRFVQEAQLASSVRHPNIVYLSDFGSLPDGRSFLVMEYLQGRTLSDAMKQGPFEVQRACMVALQLVRGILAVHAKGIVHRDLKPDNVLLIEQSGVQDMVKIIDFGIAKRAKESSMATTNLGPDGAPAQGTELTHASGSADAADEHGGDFSPEHAATLTRAGALLGTPGYMAPEQIRGGKIDRRADQYALGCILYKLMAGRPIFEGRTSVDLLAMHLMETAVPLREAANRPEISEALEALVMRLVEKKPEKRYSSLAEVEAALLAELQLPPERASFTTGKVPGIRLGSFPTDKLPRVVQTSRKPLLLAGIGAVVLVTGMLGGWLWQRRSAPVKITESELTSYREQATRRLWEDVRDADPQVRISALSAVGASHEPLALPILSAIAQGSGSDRERSAALLAIGELGERSGATVLSNVLAKASTPFVADAAAQALLIAGESKGVTHFARRMTGKDPVMAMRSAVLLCEHEYTPAITRLSTQLASKQVPEIFEIDTLTCLSRAGSIRATELLRGYLSAATPNEKSLLAAERLTKLGLSAGISYLQQLVQDSPTTRLKAAMLLASPVEKSGLPLFREVLAQNSTPLTERAMAVAALAESGELVDLPNLAAHLATEQPPAVRIAAASAILKITSRAPELGRKLDLRWARAGMSDSNWMARHSAVPLLDASAETEATELLSQALQDEKVQVRTRVIQVISRSSSKDALKLLESALKNENAAVREAALRAVVQVTRSAYLQGGSSASSVQKWLRGLAKSDDETQRAAAQAGRLHLGEDDQWAELKKLKLSADPVLRGLVAYAATSDHELIAQLLTDTDPSVRVTAALHLAQLKDPRGAQILRDGLASGGAQALRAEAGLRNLGEALTGKTTLERLHRSESVEERMAFVETAGSLPASEALTLLSEAAHDVEPYVRRLAAELVAELPDSVELGPRLAVLAHLNRDQSPLVRTRAGVLLSRILHQTRAANSPEPKRVIPPLQRTFQPENEPPVAVETPQPTATQQGELSLAAEQPILFRIDQSGWQRTPARPVKLTVGPHRLLFVAGEKSIDVTSNVSVLFELPESAAEQSLRTGRDALAKRDYRRAQKLFEKVLSSCPTAAELTSACRALQAEAGYLLGSLFETQERWGEAVTEYQLAAAKPAEIPGRVNFHVEAKAALTALLPRVGRVIIPQTKKQKCTEVTLWMAAGKHEVIVAGKKVPVVVRPGATVLAGECPSDD